MKSLRCLILVFAASLALPLVYLGVQAFRSLEAEEAATFGFFAEALLDEMQASAAELIRREEARPVDAYSGPAAAALSGLPAEDYLRGYFQNDPDGGFQTPHRGLSPAPPGLSARLAELEDANRVFNRKRAEGTDRVRAGTADAPREEQPREPPRFAERYLDLSRSQRAKSTLGEKDSRLQAVTPEQAFNLSRLEKKQTPAPPAPAAGAAERERRTEETQASMARKPAARAETADRTTDEAGGGAAAGFQAEVAPFQAVFLDDGRVFVFRRIMIDDRIFRQGFVLQLDLFLSHLARTHFGTQPMAGFAHLRLRAVDQGRELLAVAAGAAADRPRITLARTFPSPFGFVQATLACERIPPSAGRGTLNLALAVLAGVVVLGLLAIYHSTRKILDFSERQSRFVSAVTHELKTPLTNIRMYIEMLEQGMARDPEREQAYFRILQSEGARLTRLISNVLELSKLEKRNRRPNLQRGRFAEVIADVESVMQTALQQAGFHLAIENALSEPFCYDREIMLQVLINLIENSLKFGRSAPVKKITLRLYAAGDRVRIEVADTGPGIPAGDVKKIFNDFYRADNAVASAAGGTGIGLALVRRFVALLGGRVSAADHPGPGCTIRIELPRSGGSLSAGPSNSVVECREN
jgi:signal transduction histidine kinase